MEVLVGDVDVEETVLSLFTGAGAEDLSLTKSQRYDNGQSSGLLAMVGDFLHGARVDGAAFAMPGNVFAGISDCAALPWPAREDELRLLLGSEVCVFLNEVQAAALGVGESDHARWLWLQEAPLDPEAPAAVVDVGARYGRALLVPPQRAFASDTGRLGFAPRNAIERRLLSYLVERVEPVTISHVLSERGLMHLHDFLVAEGLAPSTAVAELQRAPNPHAVLARLGSRDLDRACAATVAFFVDLLGAELSNVALSCLPRGGLFLIGTLTQRLRGVFEAGVLRDAFLDRAPLRPLLETIPLVLVDQRDLRTLGARKAVLARVQEL